MNRKDFVDKFINVFGRNCTLTYKRKIYKRSRYLWQIIEDEFYHGNNMSTFEGEKARLEYNKVSKKSAFEIWYDPPFGDSETLPLASNHLTAKDIDEDEIFEFYIIGENFSWCYVVTHSFDKAGPYFCYSNISK